MLRTQDKRLFLGEELGDILPSVVNHTLPVTANLLAHYDAADESSLTVGLQRVSQWNDKSGNANHATQATFGNRPFYCRPPSGIERGGLYFDAALLSFMTSAASMSDITSSLFFVGNVGDLSGNRTMLGPSADGGLQWRATAVPDIRVTSADTAEIAASTFFPTVGVPYVTGIVLSASDAVFYFNNETPQTVGHSVGLTAGRTLVIGRAPTVASGAENWQGWMGEIIMYSATLSAANATSVMSYLRAKWGL